MIIENGMGKEHMMQYRVIAISREFGSGGRTIGRELARRLGIVCYDGEMIELLSEKSGFSPEHVARLDEQSVPYKPFTKRGERDERSAIMQTALWTKQEKLIAELAEKEPCVIVGRCADYILRDRPDCLRVFIHADMNWRAERVVMVYGETHEAPMKRIGEKDKRRKAYYQRYTNGKWSDASNYHICLDSGAIGIEACVEILSHLYQGK